jgi:hypothetical protein
MAVLSLPSFRELSAKTLSHAILTRARPFKPNPDEPAFAKASAFARPTA